MQLKQNLAEECWFAKVTVLLFRKAQAALHWDGAQIQALSAWSLCKSGVSLWEKEEKNQTVGFCKLYKHVWSCEHVGKVPKASALLSSQWTHSDEAILPWKFLRALQFPKLLKKLSGFDRWGWAALQIINYLHKLMNYSVDRVFLSSLLIEDEQFLPFLPFWIFQMQNSKNCSLLYHQMQNSQNYK